MASIGVLRPCIAAAFVLLLATPALAQSPGAPPEPAAAMPGRSPAMSVRYFLELQDRATGELAGFDWKPATFTPAHKPAASGGFVMQVGSSAPSGLYRWLAGSVGGTAVPLDGIVFATVPALGSYETLSFMSGRLTSIRFPALDATSRDAMRMAVDVDVAEMHKMTGNAVNIVPAPGMRWPASAFRVTVSNIDPRLVVHVYPFELRPNQATSLKLTIVVPEGAGNPLLQPSRTGTAQRVLLELLAEDRRIVLATLELPKATITSLNCNAARASAGKNRLECAAEFVDDHPNLSFTPALLH